MTELNETNIMAYANKSPLLLVYSAKNNSVSSLMYLIDQKYDLTFVDIDGNTVLHHIVSMNVNEKEIVELIDRVLEETYKSLLNIKNNEGITVLDLATNVGKKKVFSRLVQDSTILHEAVNKDNIEMVKLLVENGVDVNKENEYSYTPLHLAVEKNNIEIVRFLVENKANVNSENEYSSTPLHLAVSKNNIEMVRLLVENGADVNKENENSNTPLHLAVDKDNIEMVRFLVENKADINKQNKYKDTPLLRAVYRDNKNMIKNGIEIVKFLLESGANIHKKDKYNKTALQWSKNPHITELLTEYDNTIEIETEPSDISYEEDVGLISLETENRKEYDKLSENKCTIF